MYSFGETLGTGQFQYFSVSFNFSRSDWDCHHLIAMLKFIAVQTLHVCYIRPIKGFLILWLFFNCQVIMGQFYFLCFLTWHIISISVNKIIGFNKPLWKNEPMNVFWGLYFFICCLRLQFLSYFCCGKLLWSLQIFNLSAG